MKINFFGAAQTVTGTQHLLEINGSQILLDCGLYQGKRQETYTRNQNFPYDPRKLDAVILSHAHIDHSGNLPNLIKSGYRGPIYTTPASAHLANIMLLDSAHVQEQDILYVNKHKAQRGEPPVEPLYTQEDAAHVAQYFEGKNYDQVFAPAPGVTACLVDAGHILGSAAVVLDIEEKGAHLRFWFSGDIGRRGLPLLRDPVLPSDADLMIMESTYGDRPHDDADQAYEELRQMVKRTLQRRGKVIVPAFAVGRTQEIVYDLHQMMDKGEVPSVPVFVDSPLAVNATDVFKAHPECFDEQTLQFIKSDRGHAALSFNMLTYTHSVEESKALNERKDPMVIISASGMAESGRILHHLKNNIEDPKNTVLITGWQAPDTLGRRLEEHQPRVKIFDEWYELRAEVETIDGLSAHAGQDMLVEYALAVKETAKRVFLVHGEPGPAEQLLGLLEAQGMKQVSYPKLNEVVAA